MTRTAAQAASRTDRQVTEAARTGGAQQAGRTIHEWLYPHAGPEPPLGSDIRLDSARVEVVNVPDKRFGRVAAIRKQIDDGTYRVPAQALARKMIGLLDGAIEPLG